MIDEYAQEQANAADSAMLFAGSILTNVSAYQNAYAASPGAMYAAAAFSYLGNPSNNGDDGPADVSGVIFYTHDNSCPNWQLTCAAYPDYPASSSKRDVWVGLGATQNQNAPHFYSLMIVQNNSGPAPR